MDSLIVFIEGTIQMLFGAKQFKDSDQRTRKMSNLKYYIIVVLLMILLLIIGLNIWTRILM